MDGSRSKSELWLHGSSRYSVNVESVEGHLGSPVKPGTNVCKYELFGELFGVFHFFCVLKGVFFKVFPQTRDCNVADDFPLKAEKSSARMIRPHNEITICPQEFAVLEQ